MEYINRKKIKGFRLSKKIVINGVTKPLTHHYMAQELDISPHIIYKLEEDENYNPSICTVIKVANYLGVEITELLVLP